MSGPDPGARLAHLKLHDIRAFVEATLDVARDGTTLITGPNGSGKTTVLEAVAYLGTQRSFRTTSRDAMVRIGCERAIVRAELEREGRRVTVESELRVGGGARTLVNRRTVQARSELSRAVPTTVFSPDDLGLVQGPPARRRDLLDGALGIVDHKAGAALDALERVLRQRGALLRQAAGRLSVEVAATLDVWDERLVASGEEVSEARRALVADLEPRVAHAYAALAGHDRTACHRSGQKAVSMEYRPGWDGPLAAALVQRRTEDVRRATSTVGPQRDEVWCAITGRDARLHASQGEQRSLALALRLGIHALVTERSGAAPLLLLDDVFSELDRDRCRALVRHLPPGQALLTTTMALPEGVEVAAVVDVRAIGVRG